MTFSSKQHDSDQQLAIQLASDDESNGSFRNDSSLEESTDDFEYDEPYIRYADFHFPSQTQA